MTILFLFLKMWDKYQQEPIPRQSHKDVKKERPSLEKEGRH